MMSQHGYTHTPPKGSYHAQPEASNIYSPYTSTLPPPNTSGPFPSHPFSDSRPQATDHNHHVIPGLSLGQVNGTAGWQQQSAVSRSTFSAGIRSESKKEDSARNARLPATSATQSGLTDTQDDVMEEGEISDGELEDLYEPREAMDHEWPSTLQHDGGRSIDDGTAKHTRDAADAAVPKSSILETRSYSPYLSPVEMNTSYSPGQPTQYDPLREHANNGSSPRSPKFAKGSNLPEPPVQSAPTASKETLDQVRGRAKDAILRLSQLNIRFDDYLKEGIDESILHDLFSDLGLQEDAVSRSAALPESKLGGFISKAVVEQTKRSQDDEHHSTFNNPESGTGREDTSKAKQAEERKDRIARLLAAKGNKLSATTEGSDSSANPVPPNQNQTLPKVQSEKSRLIQQKMEALKARRSQVQKPVDQSEQAVDMPSLVQVTATSQVPDAAADATDATLDPTQEIIHRDNTQSASSIPGLFLSSTPQPSSSVSHKRPVASDLEDQTETPPKRLFGHPRTTHQRLVIDVSDDDDDAAMDLDSPELNPVSVNRPNSPFKIPTFNELIGPTSSFPSGQTSSSGLTPPVVAGPAKGKTDLESMHKEIENMKRKIAEAEARKKAKMSLPGSPSAQQSKAPSESIANSGKMPAAKPANLSEGDISRLDDLPPSSNTSETLPSQRNSEKATQGRRSLSRAVSDRLPVLEAYRKEQMLKLQALQSQVRRVEREIQLSLDEEKSLMENDAVLSSHSPGQEAQTENEDTIPVETVTEPVSAALPLTSARSVEKRAASSDHLADIELAERGVDQMYESSVDMAREREAPSPVSNGISTHAHGLLSTRPDSERPSELSHEALEAAGEDQKSETSVEKSDAYEPATAESPLSEETSSEGSSSGSAPLAEDESPEASDTDMQAVSTITPVTQPLSTAQRQSQSESPSEVDRAPIPELFRAPNSQQLVATKAASASIAPHTSFRPYETPLKYFRAYRFHPQFKDSIAGGLRSLTYSNKIDIQKELCPEQLSGSNCSRGSQCEFQHFESMEVPDDQILVQLGGYSDFEGQQKQEYVNGLRQLLTNFRAQKVKDFQTISQGIIDYRVAFRGDKTKILPLGDVSI